MTLLLDLGWRSVTAVKGISTILACLAVRLFVKYAHQLESVAIRQAWCERIRESICWHSGQRYVINADFTLHWIELAMIATSPSLIHPIKPSLFIYLQPQPPDMHGMRELAAPHTNTHICAHISSPISSEVVKDTRHYLMPAVSWRLHFLLFFWTKISTFCSVHTHTRPHVQTHTVSLYSAAVRWQGA